MVRQPAYSENWVHLSVVTTRTQAFACTVCTHRPLLLEQLGYPFGRLVCTDLPLLLERQATLSADWSLNTENTTPTYSELPPFSSAVGTHLPILLERRTTLSADWCFKQALPAYSRLPPFSSLAALPCSRLGTLFGAIWPSRALTVTTGVHNIAFYLARDLFWPQFALLTPFFETHTSLKLHAPPVAHCTCSCTCCCCTHIPVPPLHCPLPSPPIIGPGISGGLYAAPFPCNALTVA